MVAPWRRLLNPQKIDIVAPDGTVRCKVDAFLSDESFVIDDMSVDIEPGDEIRRPLPNGKEEVYQVIDPKYNDSRHFPAHYRVQVSKKGSFPKHSGGHYTINVQGVNARVNIGSTDNSTNVHATHQVFGQLRDAVSAGIEDQAQRDELLARVDALEAAAGSNRYMAAYQAFITSAANHMTLLAPFLPALTSLLN